MIGLHNIPVEKLMKIFCGELTSNPYPLMWLRQNSECIHCNRKFGERDSWIFDHHTCAASTLGGIAWACDHCSTESETHYYINNESDYDGNNDGYYYCPYCTRGGTCPTRS